jgi:hypothetical protein
LELSYIWKWILQELNMNLMRCDSNRIDFNSAGSRDEKEKAERRMSSRAPWGAEPAGLSHLHTRGPTGRLWLVRHLQRRRQINRQPNNSSGIHFRILFFVVIRFLSIQRMANIKTRRINWNLIRKKCFNYLKMMRLTFKNILPFFKDLIIFKNRFKTEIEVWRDASQRSAHPRLNVQLFCYWQETDWQFPGRKSTGHRWTDATRMARWSLFICRPEIG